MSFRLFTPGLRADRRAGGSAVPGSRWLALAGSAAGVVAVTVGVALLAGGARTPGGANAAHGHPSAATAVVPTATVGSSADVQGLAAYPPRTPCSLSLVRTSIGSGDLSVEGSGLGSAQTVTVVYYSGANTDATTLGTWHTDQGGSFDEPVQVPDTDGYVTARTQSVQCSTPAGGASEPVYPPTTGTTGPTTSPAPTTGPSTPSSGPVTSTSSGPSAGSSASTGPATSASSGGSNAAGPPGGSSGSEPNSAGPTSPGPTSSSGASSSGAPSSGSAPSGNGPSNSTSGVVAPNSSAPNSSAPSPTATPAAISAQSWGLSTSFLVTMVLVLLVLGGLAVLVLTRRAG